MGYETRKFAVTVLLYDLDNKDQQLWKEMLYKLKEIATHPDYEGILLDMDSWDDE